MMKQGFFITGTDTGVGKTLVTSALVHAYATRGCWVAGLKPVAAGCSWVDGRLLSEDVAQLEAASNVELGPAIFNPYAFEPAIAPHIAAEQAGEELKLEVMLQACEAAAAAVDVLLVEGVGGFRVPFGDQIDSADLAVRLGFPLVLVVGMRLGCLNHALLTAEAISARGLQLAGWVANRTDPVMPAFEENVSALAIRLSAPCLGVIPSLPQADFAQAADYLTLDKLSRSAR